MESSVFFTFWGLFAIVKPEVRITGDNWMQKMMSVMMPVMFTVFSLFLPAGLAIYTLTSYLIGILQQLYINHLDRKLHGAPVKA